SPAPRPGAPAAAPGRLPAWGRGRHRHGGRRQGVERMTAISASVRLPQMNVRRYLAAGTFVLLGLIDILVFGLFARAGDAVFALSLSGSGIQVPSIHVPGAPACFVLGTISILAGVLRAITDLSTLATRIPIPLPIL